MRFSRGLVGVLIITLCAVAGRAQNASEEELMRALDLLRRTRTGNAPALTNAPPDEKRVLDAEQKLIEAIGASGKKGETNSVPAQPPGAVPAATESKPGAAAVPAVSTVPAPVTAPVTPEPAVAPGVPAPMQLPSEPAPAITTSSPDAPVQLQLKDLLEQYRADLITPAEYQRRRYEIQGLAINAFDHLRPVKPPPAGVQASPVKAGPSEAFKAGLIPSGHLLVQIEFESARQAPIYGVLKALEAKQAEAAGEGKGAGGFSPAKAAEMTRELEKLGLKEEDVSRVSVSADLDLLQQAMTNRKAVKNLDLVIAIQLTREVKLSELKEMIQALAAAAPEPKSVEMTDETIGSTAVLALTPETEDEPELQLTVVGADTVLVGWNRRSLSSALDRVEAPVEADEEMTKVIGSVSEGAQLKVGFVVPSGLKSMLSELSAASDAGAGAPGGGMDMFSVLGFFKDLRSISVGMRLGEDVTLDVAGDLGSPGAANQLKALFELSKASMMESIATQVGRQPDQLDPDTVTMSASESLLKLSLKANKDLIEAAAKSE